MIKYVVYSISKRGVTNQMQSSSDYLITSRKKYTNESKYFLQKCRWFHEIKKLAREKLNVGSFLYNRRGKVSGFLCFNAGTTVQCSLLTLSRLILSNIGCQFEVGLVDHY